MNLQMLRGFSCFFFLFTSALMAQDFQGKAYYQSKTTMDMESFGGNQMTDQQRRMMEERMKSRLEKSYVLSFNRTESIYREEEKLAAPGTSGGRRGMTISATGDGILYKNVKEQQLIQAQEFFGKQFLIKDSIPQLVWTMGSESKQIGQYLSFKATTVIKAEPMNFNNRGRRNNQAVDGKAIEKPNDSTASHTSTQAIESPKETLVTVWYTPQIPVSQGPGNYWGLPGLILEVNDGQTIILCTKIEINPKDKSDIKPPSKGKVVTKQEYNDIVMDKMQEMREMRGGRSRGSRF